MCAGTRTETPPGPCSQRHWDPAPLPMGGISTRTTWALAPPSSRWTPAPGLLQPLSLPWQETAHPPAGWYQPWDMMGPSPAHQQANTSSEKPWSPPATMGSGPTQQGDNTSFLTPWAPQPAVSGTDPTHQWSDNSSGYPGPCRQRPQDLALPASGLALAPGYGYN